MTQQLILLHGALGAAELMRPLAQQLEGSCEVHALNFSGHGGKPFQGEFSIPHFAREVLQYMDEHELKHPAIFGFSMGGYVALYLASQHPERVSKVVTLSTKFNWSPEIAAREARLLDADKIKEKVPQFADALQKRHQPQAWEEVVQRTRQLLLGLGEQPVLKQETLLQIAQPVIVGWGALDNMVSLEESREAAAHFPQGRLKVFGDTPHPIEKVDSRMLAAFLQEQFA